MAILDLTILQIISINFVDNKFSNRYEGYELFVPSTNNALELITNILKETLLSENKEVT